MTVEARPTLSVYVCDNYGALRDLIRFSLEDDARIQVIGEAEDAITCVRELPELRPDVLILDLRMPGVTGLEAVPDIRSASPDTRIVVYSQHIDERTEVELRDAGVEAWLRKDEDLSELRGVVLEVGGL
jgi:two-component system, NarL family, invasion response regulator UvrY